MDLFADRVPDHRLHPVFKMLRDPKYLPERRVLEQWAEGFVDRDGKFVNEFQTTFESSMWELYLHAYLKEIGAAVDFAHHAPDFVVDSPFKFCIEAAIAAPPVGGPPAIGYDATAIPEDFAEFNEAAAIRIANTLSAKIAKHRSSYAKLGHAADQPFVVAIASFDRPYAHFAASRPIMAALYGVRYDEAAAEALGPGATEIPKFPVSSATKSNGSDVPLGFFCDERASDVSAVVYSCLATWGKIRALADNPDALSFYQTLHPSSDGIIPEFRCAIKRDYHEHLLDGLHVFHNPFAKHPLDVDALGHPRLAQFNIIDGYLCTIEPDDFLLMRMVRSIQTHGEPDKEGA